MPQPVQFSPVYRAGCTPKALNSGANSKHLGGQDSTQSPQPLHSSTSTVTLPRAGPVMVHLVAAASLAVGRCNHFVFSQYEYNSSRNLGCAISIRAFARSRMLLPCK